MALFYLKFFLFNLSGIFTGMSLVTLFTFGPSAAFLQALIPSALFSGLITFLVGRRHIALVAEIAGPDREDAAYRTHQSTELAVNLEYDKLFTLAHHYLVEIAGCTVSEADTRTHRITARSPLSLRSIGSLVTLDFTENSPGSTGLKISSKPRLPVITPIDYGENLKIVLGAKKHLLQNAGTK
jgi:hypothetical protein